MSGKRGRQILKAAVALVLIGVLVCGSALAAGMSAKVFSPSMAIYNKKGGTRFAALRRGTSFTVTAISGDWAKISYKGHSGYAKLKDIVFDSRVKAVTTRASSIKFVTKSSYKKGTYYTGTLAKGVTIYLAGMSGDSYLFFNKNGNAVGVVSKSAVRVEQ